MKSIYNFKLFENYKKAKKWIEDKNPMESEEYYSFLSDIKLLLKSKPNLIYNFFKYGVEQNIPLEDDLNNYGTSLKGLLDYINNNKQRVKSLPKNLIDYDKFEDLSDDITHLNDKSSITKFIKDLYPIFRKELNNYMDKSEENEKWVTEIISYYNSLDEDRKSLLPPMKYYKENNLSVIDYLNDIMKFTSSDKDSEGLDESILEDILKYDVEVIFNENNKIVLRTYDLDFIIDYGSPKWCITYAPSTYYNTYVSPLKGFTQYIVIDYSVISSSAEHKYGISVYENGKIMNGGLQDASNKPSNINKICEQIGCSKDLFTPYEYEVSKLMELSYADRLSASTKERVILDENEKKYLELNKKIELNLTDYIKDSQYDEVSLRLLITSGLVHKISKNRLVVDNYNDDDELVSFIKDIYFMFSSIGIDSQTDNIIEMLRGFFDINGTENVMDIFIKHLKYSPINITKVLSEKQLSDLPIHQKIYIDEVVQGYDKGNRDIIKEEELYKLSIDIKLESYVRNKYGYLGKDLQNYITDEEIYKLDLNDIIAFRFPKGVLKRLNEFSLTQRYKILSMEFVPNYSGGDTVIHDEKAISELKFIDKLLILASMNNSNYTEIFYNKHIKDGIDSFMGNFGHDWGDGFPDDTITIENYESSVDSYSNKSALLEELFDINDENLAYDLNSANNYDSEFNSNEDDEYKYRVISNDVMDKIKIFLESSGIEYEEEKLYDIFEEISDQFNGVNLIEIYFDEWELINTNKYEEGLSLILDEINNLVDVSDGNSPNTLELSLNLSVYSDWVIKYDIDTEDINSMEDLLSNLPSIESIISEVEEKQGTDIALNLWEVDITESDYEEIESSCDIVEKLEDIIDYSEYDYMKSNLDKLGFTRDENNKYKYSKNNITITVDKIGIDFNIYDVTMVRNGKEEKGSIREENLYKYLQKDIFDSYKYLINYDKFSRLG